jgi:hypothetical protein
VKQGGSKRQWPFNGRIIKGRNRDETFTCSADSIVADRHVHPMEPFAGKVGETVRIVD